MRVRLPGYCFVCFLLLSWIEEPMAQGGFAGSVSTLGGFDSLYWLELRASIGRWWIFWRVLRIWIEFRFLEPMAQGACWVAQHTRVRLPLLALRKATVEIFEGFYAFELNFDFWSQCPRGLACWVGQHTRGSTPSIGTFTPRLYI